MKQSKYRIAVKTIAGRFLTFTVNKFEVTEDGFLRFRDAKTGKLLGFPKECCQFEEVEE